LIEEFDKDGDGILDEVEMKALIIKAMAPPVLEDDTSTATPSESGSATLIAVALLVVAITTILCCKYYKWLFY
jgi:hypothetical protein